MGFVAPGLLWLGLLALIPLAIHILSRLRLRRADFPSLMLLQTVRRERFSWLRLKEIILLILRTLALAALLLALARPYVRQRLAGLGRARDLVVVVDDSYSMAYSDRWQRATAAARNLIGSLGPNRRGVLLTSSEPTGNWAAGKALLAGLDSLRPSAGAATLEPALAQAVELARKAGADVCVVTDLQERDVPLKWQVPEGVPVTIINVGGEQFDNAGIVRLYPEDRFPSAGRPVRMKADVINFGSRAVSRTAVLTIDGRQEERGVALKPGEATTVTFETVVGDTGAHVVQLDLRSDSLVVDDRRWAVVQASQRVKVLVVQSSQVPARYVLDALGPESTSATNLTVIDVGQMGQQDLRKYDVLLLTDAAALSRADWTRFDFYLQAGGSALVAVSAMPADTVPMRKYLRLRGVASPAGFASVTESDTSHPVLEVLGSPDLGGARFVGHARLDPAGGRVLARLSDGDPLLLEAPDGRVIVWAFAPLPGSTDLVFKAPFVPLLHRTLRYLASAPLRVDYAVGDTIRVGVEEARPVTVTTPEGQFNVAPVAGAGRPLIVFTRTATPGAYRVGESYVVVNPEPSEGDLRRAEPRRLAEQGLRVTGDSGRGTAELTPLLLVLAALAFAAELALLI